MSAELTKEQLEVYKQNWRRRQEKERQERAARREHAWVVLLSSAVRHGIALMHIVAFATWLETSMPLIYAHRELKN